MKSKPVLYNFSQDKFLAKSPKALAEQKEKFEIVENDGSSAIDVLKKGFEIIEIAPNDFAEFRDHVNAVDWKTSQLAMADGLVKLRNGTYRPFNLLPATIVDLIKKNNLKVNSQLPVIVIGEFHFVYATAVHLALSGFIEIIVSLTDSETFTDMMQKKIKSFVFDLNIRTVGINDLTTSEIVGALLISDFKKEANKEAYHLLTYFNFLSQGAIFIDCNSINDPSLVEDARKAEIAVIDEDEVISQKYNYLFEMLKISP